MPIGQYLMYLFFLSELQWVGFKEKMKRSEYLNTFYLPFHGSVATIKFLTDGQLTSQRS